MGKNSKRILAILLACMLLVTAMLLTACGEEVNIDHIEIYSSPKTEYYIGESLDLTNAKIRIVYKNNTEKIADITPFMISEFDPNTAGVQFVKIYYENQSATLKVTVKRYIADSVDIIMPQENCSYIEGQKLRLNDSYLVLKYKNLPDELIPITPAMCSGFDSTNIAADHQVVTVTFERDGHVYSSTYGITLTPKELKGIEVTVKPVQNVYYIGDTELDLTGGELFLKYDNDYSERVPMRTVGGVLPGLTTSWDNTIVDSDAIVTVSYGGFTDTFRIDVQNRNVADYTVLGEIPTQMQNLPINLTGVALEVLYTNGAREVIALDGERVRIENYDPRKTDEEQTVDVVIIYGNVELAKRAKLTVKVEPRVAVGLEICYMPTVYQATEFDVTEWQYRLVYNNGEFGAPANVTVGMIKWKDDLVIDSYPTAGTKELYISYDEGVSLNYEFDVTALRVTNIVFNNAMNVIAYYKGEVLVDDVNMTVTYNSGAVIDNVPLAADQVIFDNTREGVQRATVLYTDEYETEGFGTALNITVVREIIALDIRKEASFKEVYHVGEEFSARGIIFDITYADYTHASIYESEETFYDNWSFSDNLEEGGSLLFTIVGEHNVRIFNQGLAQDLPPVVITVTVTNNYEEILGLYLLNDDEYVAVNTSAPIMSVVQGNALDMSNYYLRIMFEGGERYVAITSDMLDYNSRNITVGNRLVAISYGDGSVIYGFIEVTVIVTPKSVVGIRIDTLPDRLVYIAGDNPTLDLTGIVVNVVYDNGTYERIPEDQLMKAGFEYDKEGEPVITISSWIGGSFYSDTFQVTVLRTTPESIEWASGGVPEAELTDGTEFDIDNVFVMDETGYMVALSGREVVIYYDDQTTYDVVTLGSIAEYITVLDYNKTGEAIQYVTLEYLNGTTLTIKVKLVARTLQSITLKKSDDSTDFKVIQGAPIDLSELKLVLKFDDNTETIVPVSAANINYDPDFNPGGYDITDTTVRDRSVTVRYIYGNDSAAKECVVTFTVREKNLVNIEIYDIPKYKYIEGESFDASVGSIMAYYDNGESEIHLLSSAAQNVAEVAFNIDISGFDSGEFNGFASKTQRIIINYSYNGVTKTTGYNIYMRNRKDLSLTFYEGNVYAPQYDGQQHAIEVSLFGYADFDATEANALLSSSSYSIEYIPENIWSTVGRESGVDYTIAPKNAGNYRIVVSYAGDGIHNAFLDDSKVLNIGKKPLYLGFITGSSMVYGSVVPDIKIVLKARYDGPEVGDPKSLLIEGDDFEDCWAFNANPQNYVAAYLGDRLLTIFDIVYSDASGNVVDVSSLSNVGTYTLRYRTEIDSPNYDITYGSETFEITKRPVTIIPVSDSYIYGNRPSAIKYSTSVTYTYIETTDVNGKIISVEQKQNPDSGLCNGDTLEGALSRLNSASGAVGNYFITLGTMKNNRNYSFNIDDNDVIYTIEYKKHEEEGLDDYYECEVVNYTVSITKRTIYVKVESMIKIYGEEKAAPRIGYYGDAACSDESGAFAPGDSLYNLGEFGLDTVIKNNMAVGQYTIGIERVTSGNAYNNYNVITISGTLEVSPRPVAVIAEATHKYYEESDPKIAYTTSAISGNPVSGLLTGDTLTGELSRTVGNDVGVYNIEIGTLGKIENAEMVDGEMQITYLDGNYEIMLTSATFTILPKELYIEFYPDKLGKIYDGKKPELGEDAIKEVYFKPTNGNLAVDTQTDLFSVVSFSYDNASKNYGEYRVRATSLDSNYTAYFYHNTEYYYTIAKRVINVTEADYYDLPDGKEYKGTEYLISAKVADEYLQPVYNVDGTPATDEYNRPVKDTIDLVLSVSRVTNAGKYTVYVTNVLNQNYALGTNEEVDFEILPKKIYIEVECNSQTDAFTREYEFDNQVAYIGSGLYVLKDSDDNVIDYSGNAGLPAFNVGITVGGNEVQARLVRYSEDGEVLSYDISIVGAASDNNFDIRMREDYKFKIVPKPVVVEIHERHLKKSYDGLAPLLSAGSYTFSQIGLDQNDISFTFTRESNDGRDNASVGDYMVEVRCNNRNYVVTLAANYIYRITAANVTVNIRSQALSKVYDRMDYAFTYDDLNMTQYLGTAPIIRNFANDDKYTEFLASLKVLEDGLNDLKMKYGYIDFSQPTAAVGALTAARDSANVLYGRVENREEWLQASNYNTMLSCARNMATALGSAYNYMTSGSDVNAASELFIRAGEYLDTIALSYSLESSYIAFVFDSIGGSTANCGQYHFTSYDCDYNHNFRISDYPDGVRVDKRILRINVEDIYVQYGMDIIDIPYIIVDSGMVIDPAAYALTIVNRPMTTAQVTEDPMRPGSYIYPNVGAYTIDVRDMYIAVSASDSTKNPNYELYKGQVGDYNIDRAKITVKLNDVNNDSFVYGSTLSKNLIDKRLNFGFRYIDIGDITESDELGQLALANGLGASFYDKCLSYFGKLMAGDTINDIISDSIEYYCYINGTSGLEIFDVVKPSAGTYTLTAEGFSTTGNNYTVEVIPATLTIRKAKISVLIDLEGYISKTYGDSGLTFEYVGLIGDTANDTYVKKTDGSGTIKALSAMTWQYSVVGGGSDPLDAATHVTGNVEYIRLSSEGYELDNYEMNFANDIPVKVVKAVLTLTPRPNLEINKNRMITALYRGVPAAGSYYYDYANLKNGDTAESLGIALGGAYAPILITRPGPTTYYNVSTYQFGSDNVNVALANANLNDYVIQVASFEYRVDPLPIRVTLDVSNIVALYEIVGQGENAFKISPYVVEVAYRNATVTENEEEKTMQVPTAVTIISGDYGVDNFIFTYPEGVEGLDAEYFASFSSKIAKSTRGLISDDTVNMKRTEVFDYTNLYRHSIRYGKIDEETGTAECTLYDMSINDTNFKFEFVPFTLTVHRTAGAISGRLKNNLLDGTDLDAFNALATDADKYAALKEYLDVVLAYTGGLGALDPSLYTLSGTIPTIADITKVLGINYSNSYTIGQVKNGLRYSYTDEDKVDRTMNVVDGRNLDRSESVSNIIPVRFYSTHTTTYEEAALNIKKGGSTYDIGTVDNPTTGAAYLTASKHNYNRGTVEFRALPAPVRGDSVVRILLNGDYSGSYLFLEFRFGDYNKLRIGYSGGYYAEYMLAYGTVFDGKTHEVKFILDTENALNASEKYLTAIISVDGKVGAIADLHALQRGDSSDTMLAGNSLLSEQSDFGVYALASEFAIRRIECSTQGLYDSTGTFISLKTQSVNLVVASGRNEYATMATQLGKFFGLPAALPQGYSAIYFVDGSSVNYSGTENVVLNRGIHRVELALYYNGSLVDYDSITLTVEKAANYAYLMLAYDRGATDYYGGMVYDAYNGINISDIDNAYRTDNNLDYTLVRDAADATKKIFAITANREDGREYTSAKYVSSTFDIIRTAVLESSTAVKYPAGNSSTLQYTLFEDTNNMVSIALKFTINQAADEYITALNYNYTISVQLTYRFGDDENSEDITDKVGYVGSALMPIPTYSVNAFIDRTAAVDYNYASGTANYVVSVYLVGGGTATIIVKDPNNTTGVGAIQYFEAINAPRLIFHDVVVDDRYMGSAIDYLVSNGSGSVWVANRAEGVNVAAGSTVTVNGGYDTPVAHAYDRQTWVYSTSATTGELTFRFNESYWDDGAIGSGYAELYRGAYLRYNIANDTFYFGIKYGNIRLLEQVWKPEDSANDKHALTVRPDNFENGGSYSTTAIKHAGVDLTAAPPENSGQGLHYLSIYVTYDDQTHEFFCPFFGDITWWKYVVDGETRIYGEGNDNPYGAETINRSTAPTFLAMYAYTRLETTADITLYSLGITFGEDNTFSAPYITESPVI